MQSTLDEAGTDAAWQQMSPLLEEAMLRLSQTRRIVTPYCYVLNCSSVSHKRRVRAGAKL